jgi:small-conductance mechanosensitive channel
MQPFYRTVLVCALATAFAAPLYAASPKTSGGSKTFKCWTNNEGVRECGESIPPEYLEGESTTIGKQGVTLDSQGRAQTTEERAAEEKRRQEAAAKAAEEKRIQDERIKADQVLLSTFASEHDITMARDRKITSVEGTIELTNVSIAKQRQVVEGYRTRVANLEKSGKPVPPELAADMATEQQKLDNKVAFIASKKAEVEALKAEYEGYLKRYRELMSQRQ